jgi:hypothetical protein
VGCDVGMRCGVVIVSGREVRFVVGGKKCRIHHAMSLEVCVVISGGHGELVVVVMPGGRAESAHRLRIPIATSRRWEASVRRRRYGFGVDFREGNPELCGDSTVFCASRSAAFAHLSMRLPAGLDVTLV